MADLNVRKRGEKWEYRFEGARVNGKRKQYSKGGFRTKKEALEAGNKALAEYNGSGVAKKIVEASVSDVLDRWLEQYVDVNLRPKTRSSYRSVVDIHIRPKLGHYRAASLAPDTLQDFANGLKTQGLSRSHVANILSALKAALGWAVEPLRWIPSNPMVHVRAPKVDKPPRKRIVLPPGDWERIISRFPQGSKWHLPLMLGYHLGLRISEAFALTWDDIDLEDGVARITKQVVKIKDGPGKAKWCFGPPKTAASARTVRIGATLLRLLRSEKARQSANRLRYGEYYTRYSLEEVGAGTFHLVPSEDGGTWPVVVDEDGSHITTDSFKYCSRVIHHELRIEFDFHSLRHTHATILVENGANIRNVQARLGHEKIETTLQTYAHDTDKMAEESVDIFETAIAHR